MGEPDVVADLRSQVEAGHRKVRAVAREIVGPDASKGRIDSKRRHLIKLLYGEAGKDPPDPEPETIREIAVALGKDPAPYLEARKRRPPVPKPAELIDQALARITALEESVRPGSAGREPLDVAETRRLLGELGVAVAAVKDAEAALSARVDALERRRAAAPPQAAAAGKKQRARRS